VGECFQKAVADHGSSPIRHDRDGLKCSLLAEYEKGMEYKKDTFKGNMADKETVRCSQKDACVFEPISIKLLAMAERKSNSV